MTYDGAGTGARGGGGVHGRTLDVSTCSATVGEVFGAGEHEIIAAITRQVTMIHSSHNTREGVTD